MHIIVAPDSYKGSLSAPAVANAMERGIQAVFPRALVTKLPIADGGEGTVVALVEATNGKIMKEHVRGPLGESVQACWGILGDGQTAVIEMAAASGLTLIPKGKLNPALTTTYGTGQLIQAALDQGIRKFIVALGGSATNDGGAGMAQALGVKFLDKEDKELSLGGGALSKLARVNLSEMDTRLKETSFLIACDVNNPLYGKNGASFIYGPQKGATPELIVQLDDALINYAEKAKQATGRDVATIPGAGAAGGLGAGLLFFTNAKLQQGIKLVLETIDFERKVKKADLVITGEGNTDYQTALGKAPVGVAEIAKQHEVPTVCISGGLGDGYEEVFNHGIDGTMSIVQNPMTLEACIKDAGNLVETATANVCRLIDIGTFPAKGKERREKL